MARRNSSTADLVGLHNDKLIFDGEGHSCFSGNSNPLFLDALDFYSNFLYPLLPCNNISYTETHYSTKTKKLVKVVDVLGREVKDNNSKILFYIYDNGTVEKN